MKIYLATASKIKKQSRLRVLMSYFAIIDNSQKWGGFSSFKYYIK